MKESRSLQSIVRFSLYINLLFVLLLASCATKPPSTTKTGGGGSSAYHEDLSTERPKFAVQEDSSKITTTKNNQVTVKPTQNVNGKVDAVLDSLDKLNQLRRFIDGFTIQIYSGQNREEAMNAKKKMTTDLADMSSRLEYAQPKFRVTVGSYFSKLDAQKDLTLLRRYFSNAILIPEKIVIK